MKMKFKALGATLLLGAAFAHASSPFGDFASKQTLQYEGTWTNTTFASSDSYTGTLVIDGFDFELTTTISGFVYGIGISVPLTFSGTIEEDLMTTLGSDFETYGAVSATVDLSKSPATITATSTPDESLGIDPSTSDATFDFENLDATFTVNFSNGGGNAVGVSNATLIAESPAVVSVTDGPTINSGETANIEVTATGSLIAFQWYRGQSGDTSNPINGANDYKLTTPALTETTSYWARITNNEDESVDTDTVTVTVNATPVTPTSLFVSGTDLGNDFFFSNWIGLVYVGTPPWYYHEAHNFFFTNSTDESTVVWIFDLELGWVFTNSNLYPSIYNNDRGAWTFYDTTSSNPRIFFDFNTNEFFTAP